VGGRALWGRISRPDCQEDLDSMVAHALSYLHEVGRGRTVSARAGLVAANGLRFVPHLSHR
jgi:hypothetical protein